MKRIFVLFILFGFISLNIGCSVGFFRDNILHPEFGVDNSGYEKIRRVENWPITEVELNNRDSSVMSRVHVYYDWYGRFEPYAANGHQLRKKRFDINIDVPPGEKIKVKVPANLIIYIKIINVYTAKTSEPIKINSGSIFFSHSLDVTPPGVVETY
ncbi:MAG: hypothetical protein U5L76_00770 [Patescibacteria group bacterium]|nr:hypothetical protein [Patescibacteria group bacterium]